MTGTGQNDPSSMSGRRFFALLGSAAGRDGSIPRLGRLSLPGRRPIETPNYVAVTSRGAVPHLTPDQFDKHVSVGAAYVALEDFIEKKEPPIYQAPDSGQGRLHTFTAFPSDRATILGARRCPPVKVPTNNGPKSIALFTSTGCASLTAAQFGLAVEKLKPDMVIALADVPPVNAMTPTSKKLVRMVERTQGWLDQLLEHTHSVEETGQPGIPIFAPVLPVEYPLQWTYLAQLAEKKSTSLAGLAIYNVRVLQEMAAYQPLCCLPRLSLDPPTTPQEVLKQVSLGVDLCTVPFVNSVSDSGVALSFTFPPPSAGDQVRPLGVDMWSSENSESLAPLLDGCRCYTCTRHHRAYVRHLLNAGEMLGWNLLQLHNHHIVGEFFTGIRERLGKGLAQFEDSREHFSAAYETSFPRMTGERPRARGYHFASEAGQGKINKPSWSDLNGQVAEG